MPRMKGFAAYEEVEPAETLAPALEQLVKEHVKLRRTMESIWKFAQQAVRRDRTALAEWLEAERTLHASWMKHVEREELVLGFLTRLVDGERGPVALMRYEHERLEALFGQFEASIAQLMADPVNEGLRQESLRVFRNVYQLKADHCAREEKAIYAFAQAQLTELEKLQLQAQFKRLK